MWVLGPFLIFYVMIRYWQVTLLVGALAGSALLLQAYPLVGTILIATAALVTLSLLRWRQQADEYRERERADH